MPVSPQAKRLAERVMAERALDEKARVRDLIARVQSSVSPPVTNAELTVCLGGYAPPEGQRGGTTVGRWVSKSHRSRNSLPDSFQRAVLEAVARGDALLAVEAPSAPGARREVLVCQPAEAVRLGSRWTVVNVAGGPVPLGDEPDWDDDDLFDPLASGPTQKAAKPKRKPVVAPVQSGRRVRPSPVRREGRIAPRRLAEWEVPPVGLGCMRLSTKGRPGRAQALEVLHAALDAGVRLLDTADVYALDETDLGHNERLIADALRSWEGPRDEVVVATKCGLARPDGRWRPDGRPEHLREAVEASLRNLGVEVLDLVQLHVADTRVPLVDSLGELARLREEGRIRHVGVCNLKVEQLEEAMGVVPLASVQSALNPWDKAAANNGVLAWCHAHRVPFVAHSPAGGHRRSGEILDDPVLTELALLYDTVPQVIAQAWLLTLGPGILTIPGATRARSAESSSLALELQLSDGDLDALDGAFPWAVAVRADTWGSASDEREVRLVMGPPASGKSSAVAPWLDRGFVRLNRDELGGRLDDLLEPLDRALSEGVPGVVLDNTYPTLRTRRGVIEVATRHASPVRVTWIDAAFDDCAINASLRMLERFGRLPDPEEIAAHEEANTIPPAALSRYFNLLEEPTPEEGFDEVERRPFVRRPTPGVDRPGLLLDMDGTLRRARSGRPFPVHPDEVEILPNRREILQIYAGAGWELVAVSNQSGVARGDLTDEQARACFARTVELLGVDIDVRYCPHPSGRIRCWCRKPMPGMGVAAIAAHRLAPGRTIMVGDLGTDEGFARANGVHYVDAEAFFGAPLAAHPWQVPD